MMTFHLLNLNQQLTTLLIASIIFKQIIVNSFKNIYQIYAYIYKSLEHLQNIQISTRGFKKRPLSLRSVRLRICRGLRIEHSLQSIFVRFPMYFKAGSTLYPCLFPDFAVILASNITHSDPDLITPGRRQSKTLIPSTNVD